MPSRCSAGWCATALSTTAATPRPSCAKNCGWGEYKIRTALQRKGVSKERIDAALSQADRPAMGERLAQQLERKARTVKYTSQYELKTKLIRYGLSLGYDYEAVMDAASAMVRETDTCNDF